MPCGSGPGAADLWAMAAELERQFEGYKRRLAERRTTGATATATARERHDAGDGAEEAGDDEAGGDGRGVGGGDVRGRMYEAYARRRDERLRDGWRARMERKEAEVKALWAQLELAAGRAGAGDPTTTTATEDGDGTREAACHCAIVRRKTERNDDDDDGRRRSSSGAALAPRRVTGKKYARTRSFSSSITTTSRNRTDVGRRRALSHEPPPSEPDACSGEASRESRAAAATTDTTRPRPRPRPRPRTSLRRRSSSVEGHGPAKTAAGPKLPRPLPRRDDSSGGPEDLGRDVAPPAVAQPSAETVAPPVPSRSAENAAPGGGTPRASPTRKSLVGRNDDSVGGGTGAANARATSPEPDRGAADEAVSHGEPDAKDDAGAEEHGGEKVDADGEVTSDSEPEPSYVYVNNKDAAEERAMAAVSEPWKLAGPDAAVDPDVKASGEETPAALAPAEATTAAAAEVATTNAEEAPARESSDESSLSARSSVPSARPSSCSSRDRSAERLLEADAAALARKKRAEKSAPAPAPRTPPGSAGSRSSAGAARSPREATVRGFKRFLSFGRKHRGREVTVIDCTSPPVPSPAHDASGRWQPAGGSVKRRMGSSDAASDDTDHGYPVSPQAACSLQSLVAASPAKSELVEIVPQEKSPKVHRSFFSFRSLNCGRG